jgi:hypothetical protein
MSTSSFRELNAADRRRAILAVLRQAVACTANAHVVQAALPREGHDVPVNTIAADFAWLAAAALVVLVDEAPLRVATLTQFGEDVAAGRVLVDGVARRPLQG